MTPLAKLLVVDDSEPNRSLLSRRLQQKGYDVSTAASGAEALAMVEEQPYSLVLLDIEMPGMTGVDVLNELRGRYSRVELPVIMVTGNSKHEDIVEAFRLGANDYVTKPLDFPVAFARIETHLSHRWVVESLRESEERYALAAQGANDGIWDWNLVTNEVHWSARWKAMLGYDDSELGTRIDEWLSRVHPDDAGRVKEALDLHLAAGSGHYESEHRLLHRDNTYRWVRCRGAAIRNRDGMATRLAGSLSDITDSKGADALTGLPNRVLFVDRLEQAIRRTERNPTYSCALLILGLNRFSALNDSLGLLTADRLLVSIARRLQDSLRSLADGVSEASGFTIARLGGDEFALLLDDIHDAMDAIRVADHLRLSLDKPFEIGGHQVFTSAAVGIAVSSPAHLRPEDMLHDAAIALHRAKSDNGGRELFDPAMREGAVSRLQIETNLRHAIESGAFIVHFQPIVSLKTGDIASFEALVRWRHPTRGLVGASEFVPIAEETGLLLEIERFALTEACRQMVSWQDRYGEAAPQSICVNVSSRRFSHGHFERDVEAVLKATGLGATALKLEITESAFIGDLSAAQDTLNALSNLGVQWSLDDFGTGYSSLSYLARLRVNTVKLDRSFVSRIGLEHAGSEMVRAIVALAHTLETDVVGEGVETSEQLAALVEFSCDYGQGFLFSPAVDAATATRLIREQPWRIEPHEPRPYPPRQRRISFHVNS